MRARHTHLAVLFLVMITAAVPGWTADRTYSLDEQTRLGYETREECRDQLARIGEAVAAYRAEHDELPHWLHELVDEGLLHSTDILVCPVTRVTGRTPDLSLYFPDPAFEGSYLYEYTDTPLLPGDAPGDLLTMREWKERCETLVGDVVPLVRCLLHGPVLNLSVGGEIFESSLGWEEQVADPEIVPRLALEWRDNDGRQSRREEEERWIGVPAPPLQLHPLSERIDLESWRGSRVLVLLFWDPGFVASHRILPHLDEVRRDLAGEPVEFLTVCRGGDPQRILEFLRLRELDLPAAIDETGITSMSYAARLPQITVVGLDGRVTRVRRGLAPDLARWLRPDIERAIAGGR